MHQLLEEIDWHTDLHSLNTLKAWDFFVSYKFLSPVWRNVYLTKRKKQNMFMVLHLKNKKKKLWLKYTF